MRSTFTQRTGSLLGIAIVALLGVSLATTSAHALLAAGTTISNTAHVDWAEDATATGVDSNQVDVTVNLVSGLVWDDTSLTPVTATVAPGGAVSYAVDLLNTGNGTTTVSLTDNTADAGVNGDSAFSTSPTTAANLTLVGTVASGAGVFGGATTTIPVYNLDVAELEVGVTRIHVNGATGTYYTVAAGSTATSLVVTGDASAVAAGDQLGEVVNITYSGTAATLAAPPASGTHDHSLTATDDVGGGLNADGNAAASDTVQSDADGGAGTDWVTTVAVGTLSINKYVRNNTTAGHNPAAAADITFATVDYWQTGVTGDTGDTLEYLVVISNTGAGAATNVIMTDTLTTAFVALTTTNISLDENGDGTFETTDAITSSDASYAAPTLSVFAGVGGADPAGGSIAASGSTVIRYQVVIQ